MFSPKTALVVEDCPEARLYFHRLLEDTFPGVIVTEAATLVAAHDWLDARASDDSFITLVDIGLPDGSGIDIIRRVSEKHRNAHAVVLTIYDDDNCLFNALGAGASGYLLKSETPETIAACLSRIRNGEPPLSPSLTRRILNYFQSNTRTDQKQADAPPLTNRETQVLTMLGLGMRVSDAATQLALSEHTVNDHIKSIYRKLNISCRAEAAIEAVRRGLVKTQ